MPRQLTVLDVWTNARGLHGLGHSRQPWEQYGWFGHAACKNFGATAIAQLCSCPDKQVQCKQLGVHNVLDRGTHPIAARHLLLSMAARAEHKSACVEQQLSCAQQAQALGWLQRQVAAQTATGCECLPGAVRLGDGWQLQAVGAVAVFSSKSRVEIQQLVG